jgi:general secretion pathway protein D
VTGQRIRILFVAAQAVWALAGCEHMVFDPTNKLGVPEGHVVDAEIRRRAGLEPLPRAEETRAGEATSGVAMTKGIESAPAPKATIERGTGQFVKSVGVAPQPVQAGEITLNFDGTDIREVVKVILGDLLQANYVLDPAVQGAATLQTGRPLRREDLLPTLETLLRMNKAAMVYSDGTYRVLPAAAAVQGGLMPQLGDSSKPLPERFNLRVVPLRYISATEMAEILKPLAPESSVVRVDTLRNLILLAGSGGELAALLDTIDVFDVDWMKGLSVGFFPLQYAKASDVVNQIQSILGEKGNSAIGGLLRMVPVEKTNSLLVVSPQERYLAEAKKWIDRLDTADNAGDGERLYVYRVKHGSAENLAATLSQIFGIQGAGGAGLARPGSLAPGLGAVGIQNQMGLGGQRGLGGGRGLGSGTGFGSGLGTGLGTGFGSGFGTGFQVQQAQARPGPAGQPGTDGGQPTPTRTGTGISQSGGEKGPAISIVADVINNSILIKSNPQDYRKILDALKELDIQPLQVLIEATIVEVALTGDLKYGLQWAFDNKWGGYRSQPSLDTKIDSSTDSGITPMWPGFNWSITTSAGAIRAMLSALAGDGQVNVLSSPSVMVLDNHVAKIQVGDQVPIATSQQQSTISDNSNIVNQISYADTGVQLSVRPRVTPGGLVMIEIQEDVSDATETTTSKLDSPTIRTRNITSNVAVKNSQAVVLGGLIRDLRSESQSGIPGLYSLPAVGWMFGEKKKNAGRTELVVVITPRVIRHDKDLEDIADLFRGKLKGLEKKF